MGKSLSSTTLVLPSIIVALLIPSLASSQVGGYYSNNAEINQVALTITITNPAEPNNLLTNAAAPS
jgi:hypothetical protein